MTEMDNLLKKPDQLKKKLFSIHFLVKATESTTFKHVHAGSSISKVSLTSAVVGSTGEWIIVNSSWEFCPQNISLVGKARCSEVNLYIVHWNK